MSICRSFGHGLDEQVHQVLRSGIGRFGSDLFLSWADRRSCTLRRSAAGESGGFLASVGESFRKTFVTEDRWKLFIEGAGNTLLITLCSILLGTLLGFAAYLFCRKGNRAVNWITNACIWLVEGLPMVVLLMILYYVILGRFRLSGLWVSVIGFTFTFGASVFGMLDSGVRAVDRGQSEAAFVLGYPDRKAFFRIILLQAARHFMPAFKSTVTAHIKATAIVGYIAVLDLTKMGDIIRSRTFDAFFPLIAVAVIYFILGGALKRAVEYFTRHTDPKRRTKEKILRGVNPHD